MKALIVYSSRTGNTEKICRAAAEVIPGCDVFPVGDAPDRKSTRLNSSH